MQGTGQTSGGIEQMTNYERSRLNSELLDIKSILFDVDRLLKKLENRVSHLAEDLAESRDRSISSNATISTSLTISTKDDQEDAKRLLIGELPTVLLSRKLFPGNNLLIEFAQKSLNLPITIARKRSRREIIGIIITEVEKRDLPQINTFRRTLDIVLKKEPENTRDFFDFWDKTIRSMQIR
jgi:hypothetical protein